MQFSRLPRATELRRRAARARLPGTPPATPSDETERRDLPGSQCLLGIVYAQFRVAQGDVVNNAVMQQHGILGHITDHAAPVLDVDILQGNAIQQDSALLGL